MVSDFQFDKIGIFSEGLASVWKDGKIGFIDVKGNLDKQGKEVIPPEFDDISGFKNDFAIVKKQNKYGIIDIKEKYKIPLKYEDIKYICKNYYAVKKEGKWGIIYINEKVIKPIEHDNAIIDEPREKAITQIFLIKDKKVLVLDFKN